MRRWSIKGEVPGTEMADRILLTYNGKIWKLPRHCHMGILHQVANMHSIFNVVLRCSQKLLSSAYISANLY